MKRRLPKGILTAAVLAARVMCQAQVYSESIPSFAERSEFSRRLNENLRTNPAAVWICALANLAPGEVSVKCYEFGPQTNSYQTIWPVSTNTLARQPRWDGLSIEAPLSIPKACALALPHVSKQYPQVQAWSVESISLYKPEPMSFPDVWCYDIAFEPRDPDLGKKIKSKDCASLYQIVLLDGTVVPPRAAKQE
jgi:hypothetical protein